MEKLKPRTLSGFMELLPGPQIQMERMMESLRKNYSLYGKNWTKRAKWPCTSSPSKTTVPPF